jgi:DNA-binding transcriptional ArsR family regulator
MTESLVLTAMAHPLRRRLIDVLKVYGPATASALADRTDQAVGNISHHMRILSAADLVEEAPELARDRRERWWRLSAPSISWSERDAGDDAAAEAVGRAASALNLDRQVAFVRHALETSPDEQWTEGPFSTDSWLTVTPAELTEFASEITAVIQRWAAREIPDDGQERQTVFTFAHGVPAKP